MVLLHIKRDDESQFLYNTSLDDSVEDCGRILARIYNGRLKITRICDEMANLMQYGSAFPPNMAGLPREKILELNLADPWEEMVISDDESVLNEDPSHLRNGKQPSEEMRQLLLKASETARSSISKKQVQAGVPLTQKKIQEILDMIRGTIMLAYPSNLPPYDPIRQELENEDSSGQEAIEADLAELWFSSRLLEKGKKLCDFLGKNEKTKVVLKITKSGAPPPPKEPIMTEQQHNLMMLHAFKKQEELKELEQDDDDVYLNSPWADSSALKKSFQGIADVKWKSK